MDGQCWSTVVLQVVNSDVRPERGGRGSQRPSLDVAFKSLVDSRARNWMRGHLGGKGGRGCKVY